MKKVRRYCPICHKECEYVVLREKDEEYIARGSSHVVARGSSHVEAWESSHVEARGSSHVVAWGSSHVVARSPYATTTIKSSYSEVSGGSIVGGHIIPAIQWLEKCGVEIKKGSAILFKSVNKDFTTRNGVSFKPRTRHVAPDWNADFQEECGAGIHYSPTVNQARSFRDEGVYVACRVKVSDLADLPAFAEYPDKIRGKGGYALYQVNEKGEKLNHVRNVKD